MQYATHAHTIRHSLATSNQHTSADSKYDAAQCNMKTTTYVWQRMCTRVQLRAISEPFEPICERVTRAPESFSYRFRAPADRASRGDVIDFGSANANARRGKIRTDVRQPQSASKSRMCVKPKVNASAALGTRPAAAAAQAPLRRAVSRVSTVCRVFRLWLRAACACVFVL